MATLADLRGRIKSALEAMPETAAKQLALAVIEGTTLADIDLEVIKDLGDAPDDPNAADRELEARLLAERGDAPGLGVLFEQVTDDVDTTWHDLAAAFAELCAEKSVGADVAAVALLLGFTAGTSSWREIVTRASSCGAEKDRLGRLARAAIASKLDDDETALAFLRAEATRFFESLQRSTTDTAALAAVTLLRRHDSATITALADAVRVGPPWGVTGRALLELMGPNPASAFAAPLEALVVEGFGRPAEGEQVANAALLARAAPERARALLATTSSSPERRAAILAAAIVADPEDATSGDEARALLQSLDPENEGQAGTALALLRAVSEAGALGFAESAARWRSAPRSKNVGKALTRWFDVVGSAIR